jgi:CDP-glycerol glycerophosphotransferase (TagB/SpsB family)
MREVLRGSLLVRAVRSLPYRLLYALAVVVTPVRRSRILFLSDSHEGFTDNFRHLRAAIRAEDPDADIRGVFKAGLRARRPLVDVLSLPFLIASSPVIVLDDFYPLIYPLRLRHGTRLVQVWHAAGAFKRVGHSRAGLPGGPVPGSDIHRNYTDAYVSSETVRADYAEAFGIDHGRVHALGVPRTDTFFDPETVATVRSVTRARYGVEAHEKLVVFAPTFRGNGQLTAYADDTADWSAIAEALGHGWRLAIRLHPFTARSATSMPEGVIDASSDVEMNDLLAAADVLVTDYSSALFEYALLRRPVVLFTPDLDDYATTRAFYRPFDDYAIGPVVKDAADLASAIRSASVDDERFDTFINEFCSALDGRSSARIASDLLRRGPGDRPIRPRVARRLRLDVLAAHAARMSLAVVSTVMLPLPRRRKLTMITREHRRPPLDFVLLKQAIAVVDPTVEVVMLAHMVPPGVVRKLAYALVLLGELYHVATARVLVVDGYSIVASATHHGDGLTIVQTWHALGALKKFGLSILDQPEGRSSELARAMRMHSNYDVVVASAERCREPFAEALGVDASQVVIAPLPRVDYLRDQRARSKSRERLASMYPDLDGSPIVVFAPTFRAYGSAPVIDPIELTEALAASGYATITKLHPLLPAPKHPALRTAPGMSTQALLHAADIFVTDYSSAVFEAAVAGVPSYLLAPDLDQYARSRSFYLAYPDDLGLPLTRSVEELVTSISARTADDAQTERLLARFVDLHDDDGALMGEGGAARRLAQLLAPHWGGSGA